MKILGKAMVRHGAWDLLEQKREAKRGARADATTAVASYPKERPGAVVFFGDQDSKGWNKR